MCVIFLGIRQEWQLCLWFTTSAAGVVCVRVANYSPCYDAWLILFACPAFVAWTDTWYTASWRVLVWLHVHCLCSQLIASSGSLSRVDYMTSCQPATERLTCLGHYLNKMLCVLVFWCLRRLAVWILSVGLISLRHLCLLVGRYVLGLSSLSMRLQKCLVMLASRNTSILAFLLDPAFQRSLSVVIGSSHVKKRAELEHK